MSTSAIHPIASNRKTEKVKWVEGLVINGHIAKARCEDRKIFVKVRQYDGEGNPHWRNFEDFNSTDVAIALLDKGGATVCPSH